MEWHRNWDRANKLRTKSLVLRLALYAPALLIIWRLFQWQVVEQFAYWERGEAQRLRTGPVPAIRGEILDRANLPIVQNAPLYQLWGDQRLLGEKAEVELLEYALEMSTAEIRQLFQTNRRRRIGKVTLLEDNLDPDKASRILVHSDRLRFAEVKTTFQRLYENDRAMSHILGYIGEASAEDVEQSKGRLVAGDRIGRRGLERIYNERLFGQNGKQILQVDARGYPLGEVFYQQPQHGKDVTLTIDWELQKFAFERMGSETGSIVAIDPKTNQILASVSTPGMNLDDFRYRVDRDVWSSLVQHPEKPLLDRSFLGQYPPGSVYKPVVALAALSEGLVTPAEKIRCTGGLQMGTRRFRCWATNGHGMVDLHRSLRESCDVYYYTLGLRLGPERIARYGRLFGLGLPTGAQVEFEKSGVLPTPQYKQSQHNDIWRDGDTLSMSIGQGYNLVTPAQIARLYGALGSGKTAPLSFVTKDKFPTEITAVSKEHLGTVREALRAVVNEPHGTAPRARIAGVTVAGKTGTAQIVSNWDRSINEEDVARKMKDHAWFAAWAPYDDPEIAVAVLVEHGAHGSTAAAPVARDVIDFFLHRKLTPMYRPRIVRPAEVLPQPVTGSSSPGTRPAQ